MVISIDRLDRLPWRKLAQVCTDTRVPAHERKLAEKRLSLRVERLTLGERVALARVAPRAVLGDLARLRELAVFGALLSNPRTTGDDLMEILQDEELPPDVLRLIAEHHQWGGLVPIRVVLVTHRSTPVHTALTVLADLPRKQVRTLLDQGALPPILEIQARRMQESNTE
jgi:hypothetical protein